VSGAKNLVVGEHVKATTRFFVASLLRMTSLTAAASSGNSEDSSDLLADEAAGG
jgi:hypothetical protein